MKKTLFLLLISHLTLLSDEGGYVFGWSHLDDPELKVPRGGTTTGPDVKLDKNIAWASYLEIFFANECLKSNKTR